MKFLSILAVLLFGISQNSWAGIEARVIEGKVRNWMYSAGRIINCINWNDNDEYDKCEKLIGKYKEWRPVEGSYRINRPEELYNDQLYSYMIDEQHENLPEDSILSVSIDIQHKDGRQAELVCGMRVKKSAEYIGESLKNIYHVYDKCRLKGPNGGWFHVEPIDYRYGHIHFLRHLDFDTNKVSFGPNIIHEENNIHKMKAKIVDSYQQMATQFSNAFSFSNGGTRSH